MGVRDFDTLMINVKVNFKKFTQQNPLCLFVFRIFSSIFSHFSRRPSA